ncbi:MAG: hypothetical protein ACQEP9_03755 [Bacillota bacterium]
MSVAQEEFAKTVNEVALAPEYRIMRWKKLIYGQLADWKDQLVKWLLQQAQNKDWSLNPDWLDLLANLVIIVGIIVIGIVIIYSILYLVKSFKQDNQVEEILGEEITEETTPNSLRAKAEQLQQAGQLRRSIRYDFIALLYLMHQQSLLYLDQAKTNQEIYLYLEETKFFGLDSFKELVTIFNATWYGHQDCDQQSYHRWTVNLNSLWSEVASDD